MGAGIDPFGMAPSHGLIRGETLGQHNINIDNNDQNPKNSGRWWTGEFLFIPVTLTLYMRVWRTTQGMSPAIKLLNKGSFEDEEITKRERERVFAVEKPNDTQNLNANLGRWFVYLTVREVCVCINHLLVATFWLLSSRSLNVNTCVCVLVSMALQKQTTIVLLISIFTLYITSKYNI